MSRLDGNTLNSSMPLKVTRLLNCDQLLWLSFPLTELMSFVSIEQKTSLCLLLLSIIA